MPRFKLTIEYDGTAYYGWQVQPDLPTVQGRIETAIYQFCAQEVTLTCAGRTDAGVHAWGQVAHADIDTHHDAFRVMEATNYHLRGSNIAITHAEIVPDTFSARFDAKRRYYHYKIVHGRRAPLALEAHRIWRVTPILDVDAMQQAIPHFIGKHDFSSFRDSQCQANSPVRTLDQFTMIVSDDRIDFKLEALSFLHHQVRIMVGTLVDIGKSKYLPEDVPDMIAAKHRTASGVTAPAYGLYFVKVAY